MVEKHRAEAAQAKEIAHDEHDHPTPRFYVMIGVILTIITAVEVAVFYVEALASVLVYILMVLTAGKFALVVGFYMHLKQDSPIFRFVFFAPMTLAVGVVVAMILLFRVFPMF